MKKSMLAIELFCVPTTEILEEVKNRQITGKRIEFTHYSGKELLEYLLDWRRTHLATL